jgi:GTP cyclohydrolase I
MGWSLPYTLGVLCLWATEAGLGSSVSATFGPKLVRLVQMYARRFQIQERMTAEIANALDRVLEPQGVAVVIEGTHGCMTSRGVSQREATMVTSRMLGVFREQPETRQEFLSALSLRRCPVSGFRSVA